jgi:co-chaperonin GroES (HSP10)
MKPLNKYIFLSYEKEKDTEGIILSDVSKDKPAIFKVTSVGDLVEKVQEGDEIVVSPFDIREIKIKSQIIYYIEEQDVLAKI